MGETSMVALAGICKVQADLMFPFQQQGSADCQTGSKQQSY